MQGLVHNKILSLILSLMVLLLLILFFSIFFTVGLRVEDTSFAWYITSVVSNFKNFFAFIAGEANSNGMNYTFYRILMVGLVGAALATSGAVYQGVFRNPMASPGILGVQSGGVLAGTIYIFFFAGYTKDAAIYSYSEYMNYYNHLNFLERYTQQIVIFIGSILTVAVIVTIAKVAGGGRMSTVTLLITGSVFSSFFNSGLELARYYLIKLDPTDTRVSQIQIFMMGTFNDTYSFTNLLTMGIPIIVCIVLLLFLGIHLNTLVFGEEEAKLMGVKVPLLRNTLILLATILTAITIAFCGQIGFIGLMVPHLARFLVGSDFHKIIPVSMLLGAGILMFVYDITTFFNLNTYINMFISIIGGPLFILLMIRARRERSADWA